MIARQIEFPLVVPVCAWCRPGELGNLGSVSHGICPRHLRALELQLAQLLCKAPKPHPSVLPPRTECRSEALLPL
ncbi:MAG TPA: hypothetical protein VNT26_19910 [Candidatus Sulfotelmatobacter sp.]|nr:hypothetical protein [Candidatus Sulfotelmatobacter sp.]